MPLDPKQFQSESEAKVFKERVYGSGDAGWIRHWNSIEDAERRGRPLYDPVGDFDREEDYREI